MTVFRKVIFSICEGTWYKVFFNTETETWEYDAVEPDHVPTALAQLETDFPSPAFSWVAGYEFLADVGKPSQVFDKVANPS